MKIDLVCTHHIMNIIVTLRDTVSHLHISENARESPSSDVTDKASSKVL